MSIEMTTIILSTKADLPTFEHGDVNITWGPRGGATGLEDAGSQGGAFADLVELLGTEVVNKDVEWEDVTNSVEGVVLGEERVHGAIVDSEDCDGEAAVDIGRQVSKGQVMVEGGEFRVFGQYACDVVSMGGGGKEEDGEEWEE